MLGLTERRERRRAKAAILKPKHQPIVEDDVEDITRTSKKRRTNESTKKATLPAGLALMQKFDLVFDMEQNELGCKYNDSFNGLLAMTDVLTCGTVIRR